MPIASFKPDLEPRVQPSLPTIEPKEYKSILADNDKTPLVSLISYVSGAPWAVNYYSQTISEHNDLREHDPGQENVYQQFTKINRMELRVKTPLSSSQDTETSIVTVTGSALVYPFLVPKHGDMFVGNIGDGHDGLFRVIDAERSNFNRDSAYSITYDLVCYVDDLTTGRIKDLEDKVTKETYFHKDRLIEGLNPTVLASENQAVIELKDLYVKLTNYYFKTFFDKRVSTLVVPGQEVFIYDSYLVDYILKIVTTFDAYEIRYVKNLNTENDPHLNQPQFWQALLERDEEILGYGVRDMGLAGARNFTQDPMLKGIRYSKIDYIVYPKTIDTTLYTDSDYLPKPIAMQEIVRVPTGYMNLASLADTTIALPSRTIPAIPVVSATTGYLFDLSFYDRVMVSTALESLVLDYIRSKPLDNEMLWKVASSYRKWGRLEQFYYIPIIMTLIKFNSAGL